MKPEEAASLVRQVRSGDLDAFAPLVEAHQQAVWRTVSFAASDISAVEDLVQETFISAFRNIDQFDTDADFGAWLRGIARNTARMELRRRGREDRKLKIYGTYLERRLAGEGKDRTYEESLHDALAECRGRLAAHAREALSMRYDEGKSFGEVAGVLGRTVAAARELLQRTRVTLRTCIAERMGWA
jgi:RNA polymerase sigma-70 factor (ECF subfamily)